MQEIKPEMLPKIVPTERYLGDVSDPSRYIPKDPLPGWRWSDTPQREDGEIDGAAARGILRGIYKGEGADGFVYCITCESAEKLREEIKRQVNFFTDLLGMQLIREGFMGDTSYELKWDVTVPHRGIIRFVLWTRGNIAGEVQIRSYISDPRSDTFKWVRAMDNLMKPMKPILEWLVPILLGLGVFGGILILRRLRRFI